MVTKNEKTGWVSRREFIKSSAVVSLAGLGVGTSRMYAAGSGKMRVGLVGCGSRGTGAAMNASKLDLTPEKYELGDLPVRPVAIPGKTKLI